MKLAAGGAASAQLCPSWVASQHAHWLHCLLLLDGRSVCHQL